MEATKIEQKIKADLTSSNTFIFINPEPLNEISPTIPDKFPKDLIPKEFCEKQLKDVLCCMIERKFDNAQCEDFQGELYKCKKWRDNLLISRIKDWETNYYEKLPHVEKEFYLQALQIKRENFLKIYDDTPVLAKNKGKRVRISSDIQQVNWRIRYLEEMGKKYL
jgi:hypothetical protein